jgi:ribosome recycling factor
MEEEERHNAEDKKRELEESLATLNKEYMEKLNKISQETERMLSDNELREFKSRIAVLNDELMNKTR